MVSEKSTLLTQEYRFNLTTEALFTIGLSYQPEGGFNLKLSENGKVCEKVMLKAPFALQTFSKDQLNAFEKTLSRYTISISKEKETFTVTFKENRGWLCCRRRKELPSKLCENIQTEHPLSKVVEAQPIEKIKAYISNLKATHVTRSCAKEPSMEEQVDLEKAVKTMLEPTNQVNAFCILGGSAMGTEEFCIDLAKRLLAERKSGGPLPLLIDYPSLVETDKAFEETWKEMTKDTFKIAGIDDGEIIYLRKNCSFYLIFLNCDGYGVKVQTNPYRRSEVNQLLGPKGKVIYTWCTQFMDLNQIPTYCAPKLEEYSSDESQLEVVYISRLTKEQVLEHPYIDLIQKYGLSELARIPFFFNALKILLTKDLSQEDETKDEKNKTKDASQEDILDELINMWIRSQMKKLEKVNIKVTFAEITQYCTELAEHGGKIKFEKSNKFKKGNNATPWSKFTSEGKNHLRFCAPVDLDKDGALVFYDPILTAYFNKSAEFWALKV